MVKRIVCLAVMAVALGLRAYAGPIDLGTWYQFSFTDVGVPAAGCDPADPAGGFCIPSSVTPTTFLDAPPWTFAAPGGILLTVTDAFLAGDIFEAFDFGLSLGLTSVPGDGDCGDDPVPCLASSFMSSGTFALIVGDHSITIVPTGSLGGGSGYLLVEAVPEPSAWLLLGSGLATLGLVRLKRFRSRLRS